MKPRKVYLCVAMASLLAATACKNNETTPTPAPPIRVTATVVTSGAESTSRTYSGTVSASSTTSASFAVPGTIEHMYAEEGQHVSAGQLLATLKSGDYANADNIAEAQLAEAQDAYNRLKKLHDANALPEIKWVEIQQKLKQAQNTVEMSRRTLGESALHSPVSGVVSRKLKQKGENVLPIQPVYEIVSLGNLEIEISVGEDQVGRFAVGQKARVAIRDMEPVEGKVSQIGVVADPLTRGYKVKIALPKTTEKILPGMLGNVSVDNGAANQSVDNGADNCYALPSQAVVLNDDNRTFVWVVKNGKAERRFVVSDEMVSRGVLVKTGLCEGDTVIIEGMQKVGTGSRVDVNVK